MRTIMKSGRRPWIVRLLTLGTVVAVVCYGTCHLIRPTPIEIPQSIVEQILAGKGMTQRDVELLLGMPPGDYRTREVHYWSVGTGIFPASMPPHDVKEWIFDSRCIVIWAAEGRVIRVQVCAPAPAPDPSWLERVGSIIG